MEFVRFLLLGGFSFTLGLGLSALFVEVLALPAWLSVGLSLAVLLPTNFWLNRWFVFKVQQGSFSTFAMTSAGARGLEYLAMLWLLSLEVQYLVAFAATLVASNLVKFFAYRTVFKDPQAVKDFWFKALGFSAAMLAPVIVASGLFVWFATSLYYMVRRKPVPIEFPDG